MLLQRRLLFFSPSDSLFLTTVAPWPLASKTSGRKSWLLSKMGTSEEACKEAWGWHTHTLQGLYGRFYVKTFGRLSAVLPKVAPVGWHITIVFTQPWTYGRMGRVYVCVIQQKNRTFIIWLPTHQLGQYLPEAPPFQPDTILILLWYGNIHNRKPIMRLCEKCRFHCSTPFWLVIYEIPPAGKVSQCCNYAGFQITLWPIKCINAIYM